MPHLVNPGGGMRELVCRLYQDIGRTGDQVMGLQEPIDRGFRDKTRLLIGISHRQLPGRQIGFLKGQVDDLGLFRLRQSVPGDAGRGIVILKGINSTGFKPFQPVVDITKQVGQLVKR